MCKIVIVALLCACSSIASVKNTGTATSPSAVGVESDYEWLEKELEAGNYDLAKTIADTKKLNRSRVVAAVLKAMWQKVNLGREVGAGEARDMAKIFGLDRATELAFARKIFAFLVKSNSCEIAADVAMYFGLGSAYADKAINCASEYSRFNFARLACRRPGTKQLQRRLIGGWVKEFEQSNAKDREYPFMALLAEICPLTADQLAYLFAVGLQDKYVELALSALNNGKFKKIPADYDNFIALAVSQYQCGMAATVALEHKLSEAAVEAIFLHRKCFGNNFLEVSPKLVSRQKAVWFFDLNLRAQKFLLARYTIEAFSLGWPYFERAVYEGLAAHAYEEVLDFAPWFPGETREYYRERILNRIFDANEEWFVVSYVVSHSQISSERILFTDAQRNIWVERAFLRAFHRGAYDLAADIAHRHQRKEFADWAVRLVFEETVRTKNADAADYLARRWHLGKEAERRVMLLYWEKNKAEARERARERELKLKKLRKHKCVNSQDWSVKPCQ